MSISGFKISSGVANYGSPLDNGTFYATSGSIMQIYTAVIERCPQTHLFVGFVPGFSGAHAQGEVLGEVNRNLREVISMLLEERR